MVQAFRGSSRAGVDPHLDPAAAATSPVPQSAHQRGNESQMFLWHEEHRGKDSPTPPFPKNRPDFVEEDGGGGFWICEAVGARLCRMEYVRCMMDGCVI